MLPQDIPETAIELLRRMKLIRCAEETIAERYSEGKMRCPTHLSVGQEAVGAAAGLALDANDHCVSTHRCHAHYLGKGGDLMAFMAELYGKETGCSSGRGGSMHLVDLSVGFLASTAIVGNSIPLGVGAALSNKIQRNGRIACVFLGDAAVESGVFHEAANFAVLRKLPVLFVCENNLYSVYTHLWDRQPEGREIWEWVAAVGMRSENGDGNDAWATYAKLRNIIEHVREGQGPAFVEFYTYRWREHCGPHYDNDLGYRSEQEFKKWKALDPIPRFEKTLLGLGVLDEQGIRAIERDISQAVNDAFDFAEDSPFPPREHAFTHLFAE